MQNNAMSVNTILYMMAKDVALDLAGFDPRNIELSGDRVVVSPPPPTRTARRRTESGSRIAFAQRRGSTTAMATPAAH